MPFVCLHRGESTAKHALKWPQAGRRACADRQSETRRYIGATVELPKERESSTGGVWILARV